MIENSIKKVFIDTAPFIYFFEGDKKESIKTRDMIFKYCDSGKKIYTSYLTDVEMKIHPKRNGSINKLMAMEQFFKEFDIERLLITRNTYDIALEIRATCNFSLIDSFQLAIAQENKCDVFITSDKELLSYKGIKVSLIP